MGCGCASSFDGGDNQWIDNEVNESKVLDFNGDFNASNNIKNDKMNNYLQFDGNDNAFSNFGKAKAKLTAVKKGMTPQQRQSLAIAQANATKMKVATALGSKPVLGVGSVMQSALPNSFYLNRKAQLTTELNSIQARLMTKSYKSPIVLKALTESRSQKTKDLVGVNKILAQRGLSGQTSGAVKNTVMNSIALAQKKARDLAVKGATQKNPSGIMSTRIKQITDMKAIAQERANQMSAKIRDKQRQQELVREASKPAQPISIKEQLRKEGLDLETESNKIVGVPPLPSLDPIGLDPLLEDEILTQAIISDADSLSDLPRPLSEENESFLSKYKKPLMIAGGLLALVIGYKVIKG